ncbi:ATP-binding protein [Maridesulfovibrio bastinii]|uniref:ATP-binding protein n=1 Tax=Maridesulfovibrio bastinii TaxID=47157 RepID=UPI0004260F48|nr:ATP-binding protein [Maridesulfovibrio bastinii]
MSEKIRTLIGSLDINWELFQFIFHNLNDTALIFEVLDDGSRGPIVDVNDATCQRLGYTRDELIGMTVDVIDSPKTLSDRPPLSKRFIDSNIAQFEIEHLAKDGTPIPAKVHAYKFKKENKSFILAISQENKEINHPRNHFEQYDGNSKFNIEILDNINSAVLIYQLENKSSFALKYKNIKADNFINILDKELGIETQYEINTILEQFLAHEDVKNKIRYSLNNSFFDFKIIRIDINTICLIIEYSETQSSISDVVKDREEHYRAFFEHNYSVMYILDPKNGNFIDSNSAAIDFYGYPKEQLLKMNIFDINAFPTQHTKNLLEQVHKNQISRLITKHKLSNGEIRDVEVYTSTYRHKNQEKIISIVHDITERLKKEVELKEAKKAAENANKSKNEFLANMSHELRTPLNGVIGMLQLLTMSTTLDATQKEYTDYALESCMRLTNLVGDILDLSKIEAGSLAIRNTPIDMLAMVNSLKKLFNPAAYKAAIDFKTNISSTVPAIVIGDENRLHQILSNIIGNSIKFTQSGYVELDIDSLKNKNPKRINLIFTIKDSGIGIEQNSIEKLFEPFTQGDEGNAKKFQGAGLGLAIVKKLVKIMDGKLDMTSEKGLGTTVSISLPFYIEQANNNEKDQSQLINFDTTDITLLIVEDDKINQLAIKKNLEKYGYAIITADNGFQSIEKLKEYNFDLILMDIQMPVMTGIEATKAIREGKAGKNNTKIPIIAVTAYAMSGDEQIFINAGMTDYIAKPIKISELLKLIEKHTVTGFFSTDNTIQ